MANHAYASLWCRGFSEATMLGQLETLLRTVPFSAERPGFAQLVIRAIEPTETPLVERDLRLQPVTPADLVELARQLLHADSAYEVQAHWDLWLFDTQSGRAHLRPQLVEIICFGEKYDEGVHAEAGHFQVDLGFEHLFTGHARLLGSNGRPAAAPLHPTEAAFLERMAKPETLREYHEKTRQNIRKLHEWMQQIEAALPVERSRLWSEGEENFEARLDEILAAR